MLLLGTIAFPPPALTYLRPKAETEGRLRQEGEDSTLREEEGITHQEGAYSLV